MRVIRIVIMVLIIALLYSLAYAYLQKEYSKAYYDALLRLLNENHVEIDNIKEKRGFFSSHLEAHLKFSDNSYEFKHTFFLVQDIFYGPLLFAKQGFQKNIHFGKAYIHSQLLLSEYPKIIESCFKKQPLLQTDTIISLKDDVHTAFYQGPCELSEPLLSWSGLSGEFNLEQDKQRKIFFSLKLPQAYFSTKDTQAYLNNLFIRAAMHKLEGNWLIHSEARISEVAVQYQDESLLDAENISFTNNARFIRDDIETSLKLVAKKVAFNKVIGTLITEASAIINHIHNDKAFGFTLNQDLLVKTNEGTLSGLAKFSSSPSLQGTLNLKYSKSLLNALDKDSHFRILSTRLGKKIQPWLSSAGIKEENDNYLFDSSFPKLELQESYKRYFNFLSNFHKNKCEVNIATAKSWGEHQIYYGFAGGNMIGEHAKRGPLLLSIPFNCYKVENFQTVYAIVDKKEIYFSKPYEKVEGPARNLLFPEDFIHFPLKIEN